jgi:hypothetical protein
MFRCLSVGFREDWGCGGDDGMGADEDALCLATGSEETVLWFPLTRWSPTFAFRPCRRFTFIDLDFEVERELALERLERLLELEYELELELDVDDDVEKDDPDE